MPDTYKIKLIQRPRKTILLKVISADTLEVVAPPHVDQKQIQEVLIRKQVKIETMFASYRAKHGRIRYTTGTTVPYLGTALELTFVADSPYVWKLSDTLIINQVYQPKTHLVLRDFYKTRAVILHKRCLELAHQHHLIPNRISLRFVTSRWGSCSKAGNISLSIYLMMAPPEVADAVIIHELAHLKHQNHSAAYWNLVAELMPDYQIHHAWLKRNSHLLRIRQPEE